ncbi:MAG: glycoside hydrolase family 2 protein [Acutalibacter sp.]|nr:glycoside hydrolase family 2 protein [Acutalibacter sp.]
MRTIHSFNQGWQFYKTKPTQSAGEAVTLPHTWNAVDGQDGGNDYYRGTCWYVRELKKPELRDGERVWLEINGAAMTAEVYFNGEKLARHEGGYSTFRVDLTDHLDENNSLAISVDNSDNDTVYPQKADFTFYGGLYRDVNLLVVPAAHFALGYCGTPGIKVTPIVDLTARCAEVTVEAWVEGEAKEVRFTVDSQTQTAPVEDGHAAAVFTLENVHLWDGVDDPYLYTAVALLDSGDEVSTHFGCRKFEIDAQKGFLLNGRSYPLRGGSRHQDRFGVGNALSLEHHKEDMAIIRELGANTLRLAHYQHAREFYDLCDENGIIVWAEIPYITQHMTGGRANTLSQMEELVVQNYNHPSIAVWGLSNEITAASTVNEELLENHRALNDLCHRLDATRPTTMANVFMLEIESPILEIPDVNSYNLYFGWYLGELEQNDEFFDEFHAKYPDRPIGFSEYGADANPQYQSPMPEKGDYTESYQAVYHEHMLQMIEARPWLWATHVWNLFDFAADGRNEGGKNGQNQKGLVTFDRKEKKDAFYLYKAAWNKTEPFVHLCGSRYVDRTEDVTEIKVYSNQSEVSLYVDGKLAETKSGKTVFKFKLPISGTHSVEARAASCASVMLIRKVDAPNPEYALPGRATVVNWFDQGEIDPDCYSVNDKLGELQQDPQAGTIINQMMSQGAAQHGGDVATAVKDNPGLIRMMSRMTLISLLKQSGASAEQIQQLNRVLQSIKKPQ